VFGTHRGRVRARGHGIERQCSGRREARPTHARPSGLILPLALARGTCAALVASGGRGSAAWADGLAYGAGGVSLRDPLSSGCQPQAFLRGGHVHVLAGGNDSQGDVDVVLVRQTGGRLGGCESSTEGQVGVRDPSVSLEPGRKCAYQRPAKGSLNCEEMEPPLRIPTRWLPRPSRAVQRRGPHFPCPPREC
jgi:hypothetical protein